MAKSDMIEVEGVVVESLPNTTFQVDIGNGHTISYKELRGNSFIDRIAQEIAGWEIVT